MRVVLGVSGGIAAYKACSLLRLFTEHGHDVTVVPTAAALHFVGAPTWSALSGKPVSTEVWTSVHEVPHVRIGQSADLVVVAPATADLLAKAAHGLADDLLTNTLLTARCPVAFAPAMHTEMWEHPATQANVATLRARGAHVIDPAVGRLTGKDTGAGRLPEPEALYAACLAIVSGDGAAVAGEPRRDLEGRRVVVSAGGTREPLDPVRYLTNRSSGRMGYAIAAQAVRRGAAVTLVTGPTHLAPPAGVRVIPVQTALEMRDAVLHAADTATVVIKAAAVADYRPSRLASEKISSKQNGLQLELQPTPDILRELGARKGERFLVGFAAETHDLRDHAQAKLIKKGVDLIVANDVSRSDIGFDAADNEVVLLDRWGGVVALPRRSKVEVADLILDRVQELRRTVRAPQAI
jgi:phosphopantothenoylcysteine decarboxylase/phosphopantothenate--cysteine ligase